MKVKACSLILVACIGLVLTAPRLSHAKEAAGQEPQPQAPGKRKTMEERLKEMEAAAHMITERRVDGVTILEVKPNLDSYLSVGLRFAIYKGLKQGKKNFLLDLGQVKNINDDALCELTASWSLVAFEGGKLKLLNLTRSITDLLTITKLLTVFDSYDTESEALKSFR